EFLQETFVGDYAAFRLAFLQFCLREALLPSEVVQAAGDLAWTPRHAGHFQYLAEDWPVRAMSLAHRCFWGWPHVPRNGLAAAGTHVISPPFLDITTRSVVPLCESCELFGRSRLPGGTCSRGRFKSGPAGRTYYDLHGGMEMFCANCGARGEGRYCVACGT